MITPSHSPSYRPDIDGLRAIAIISVMLFHAGVDVAAGGFVGLDVFFVVSGYLIARIIRTDMQAGRFTLWQFYLRRIRRLLPALFLVMIAVTVMGAAAMLSGQYTQMGKSLVAALFFLSNVFFARVTNYFGPAAEFMPLIHVWSLSVEEQFYLILPVIMLMSARLMIPQARLFSILLLPAFLLGLYLSHAAGPGAYYMMPARAWEFLVGVVIALNPAWRLPPGLLREMAVALGMMAIMLPVFLMHGHAPYPGFAALLPVLGTGLVIVARADLSRVGNPLSHPLMVGIGLISYSLYLWHWPVFVMARLLNARQVLDSADIIVCIAISFVLAILTWHYIEKPFRNRGTISGRVLGLTLIPTASALLLAGLMIWQTGGLPRRMTPETMQLQAGSQDVDPLRSRCMSATRTGNTDAYCAFGPADRPVTYALVGASHAAALRPAVEQVMTARDRRGVAMVSSGCLFLDGVDRVDHPRNQECRRAREKTFDFLARSPDIDLVIIGGRWTAATTGIRPEKGIYRGLLIRDADTITPGPAENAHVFRRSMQRSIDRLLTMGKRVVVIGPVPENRFDVPVISALTSHNHRDRPAGRKTAEIVAEEAIADTFFTERARRREITYLPLRPLFCPDDMCRVLADGRPLYADANHLSLSAARDFVGPYLMQHFPETERHDK